MGDIIDLLQIKIEKAKAQLSEDTTNAINAVDWKAVILGMRDKKGYNFEQLGDLELETELLLCGLLKPEDYPKELEKRMKISPTQVNDLVNEMNKLVFEKIKQELIKNSERKKLFINQNPVPQNALEKPITKTEEEKNNTKILNEHGIEILNGNKLPVPEKLELDSPLEEYSPTKVGEGGGEFVHPDASATPQEGNNTTHPILAEKLSGYVSNTVVKTEHSMENITKTSDTTTLPQSNSKKYGVDPYREKPE